MDRLELPSTSEDTVANERGIAKFTRRSLLTFGTTGKIKSIMVDEGATVSRGQLLGSLWDDVAVARVAEAKTAASSLASSDVARHELQTVEADLHAVTKANSINSLAFSPLRQTKLQLQCEAASDLVRQRQEEIALAERAAHTATADLASLRLEAPFDGIVVRRLKHEGEGVNPIDPVLELVDDKVIRIEIFVTPEIADQISVGMPAQIDAVPISPSRPGEAKSLDEVRVEKPQATVASAPGKVGFVDLSVQPVRQVVRVWVEANRPAWIRDGSQVGVRILNQSP